MRIDCPDASSDGHLVLVPGGARLTLSRWIFINENQWLSIHFSGVAQDGTQLVGVLRDSVAVSESEVKEGVRDVLPYEELDKLKSDSPLSVWASVSFDGTQWWRFPTLYLTFKR